MWFLRKILCPRNKCHRLLLVGISITDIIVGLFASLRGSARAILSDFAELRASAHYAYAVISLLLSYLTNSARFRSAPFYAKSSKKRGRNVLIGIKNSWKYEKDYLHLTLYILFLLFPYLPIILYSYITLITYINRGIQVNVYSLVYLVPTNSSGINCCSTSGAEWV